MRSLRYQISSDSYDLVNRFWGESLRSVSRAVRLGLGLALMLPAMQLDREFVRETVNSLALFVHREYVDAEAAARVDTLLRQWLASGRYAYAQTPEALAGMLTRDLLTLT